MKRESRPDRACREFLAGPSMARPIAVTVEDEHEFRSAMDAYKGRSGRQFPTWSEILEVLQSLGYAKRIWRPVDAWTERPAEDAYPKTANAGLVDRPTRDGSPVGT